jgi:predicted RNA-binding protein associated with RNAse of E/G family
MGMTVNEVARVSRYSAITNGQGYRWRVFFQNGKVHSLLRMPSHSG